MGQAQINVRIRACSRTSIARTKQAALTHNVRGKELRVLKIHWFNYNNIALLHVPRICRDVAQFYRISPMNNFSLLCSLVQLCHFVF